MITLSPIPTQELANMHLKAISAYLNARFEMNYEIKVNGMHSAISYDKIIKTQNIASDLHEAYNARLPEGLKMPKFSAFIAQLERM